MDLLEYRQEFQFHFQNDASFQAEDKIRSELVFASYGRIPIDFHRQLNSVSGFSTLQVAHVFMAVALNKQ
jgi:hypothetical protein